MQTLCWRALKILNIVNPPIASVFLITNVASGGGLNPTAVFQFLCQLEIDIPVIFIRKFFRRIPTPAAFETSCTRKFKMADGNRKSLCW